MAICARPGEIHNAVSRHLLISFPRLDFHRLVLRRRFAPLALLCAALLLSACANGERRPYTCRGTQAPSLPYSLMSHTERTDNLPDETVIAAHFYRVRPDRAAVKPCSEVAIVKEIHLRRATNRPLQLRERREFYAADGTLVAQSEEDLGARLLYSGNYRAVQVLPIPAGAPPGRYRMIADLYLEDGDNPPILLNSAQTELRVLGTAAKTSTTAAKSRPRVTKSPAKTTATR